MNDDDHNVVASRKILDAFPGRSKVVMWNNFSLTRSVTKKP